MLENRFNDDEWKGFCAREVPGADDEPWDCTDEEWDEYLKRNHTTGGNYVD